MRPMRSRKGPFSSLIVTAKADGTKKPPEGVRGLKECLWSLAEQLGLRSPDGDSE